MSMTVVYNFLLSKKSFKIRLFKIGLFKLKNIEFVGYIHNPSYAPFTSASLEDFLK